MNAKKTQILISANFIDNIKSKYCLSIFFDTYSARVIYLQCYLSVTLCKISCQASFQNKQQQASAVLARILFSRKQKYKRWVGSFGLYQTHKWRMVSPPGPMCNFSWFCALPVFTLSLPFIICAIFVTHVKYQQRFSSVLHL